MSVRADPLPASSQSGDETCAMPVRPRTMAGESAYGYFIRVADGMGYPSPRALWHGMRRRYESVDGIRLALKLKRAAWAGLQAPWPSYCGVDAAMPDGLDVEDICHSTMRWCPCCLGESAHLGALWGVKLVCACMVHRVLLLDECPRCGAEQKLERADIDLCQCGFRLALAKASPLSASIALVQRGLWSALLRRRPDARFALTPAMWLKLLNNVGRIAGGQSLHKTGQVGGLHRVAAATALSATLGDILSPWPKGLQVLLKEKQDSAQRSFSIPRTFGRIYKWLYVDLNAPCFQFMRDEFEAYLREHWWGLVCERNRRISKDTKRVHRQRSISAIADAAGAAPSVVRQLHLTGWIDANTVPLPSGRQAWTMLDSTVDQIKAHLEDGVDLQTAAFLLGLPKRRVKELISAGLIAPKLTPKKGATAWLISRSELASLLQRCIAEREEADGSAAVLSVQLVQVLKSWRLQAGEFPALIQAMLDGDVQVARSQLDERTLGRLDILVPSLQRWRERREDTSREWLSVDAASRLLGVKQQVGYELMRAGLLASHGDPHGTAFRRIHRTDLTAFQHKYVALSELAQITGRSSKALLQALLARPVCGPTIDGIRQYFFLRADLPGDLAQLLADVVRARGHLEPGFVDELPPTFDMQTECGEQSSIEAAACQSKS